MTTHYDGVSDVAGAHYQVAGLVRDIQGDEGDDPRKRIARRMDYRLLPAPPGAPCPGTPFGCAACSSWTTP